MQYPQIQFYRGSLVRLASGKLKQVEDLNSDDFLESARVSIGSSSQFANSNSTVARRTTTGMMCGFQQGNMLTNRHSNSLDDNNNSVFNSPEATPSFDSSPTMDIEMVDGDIGGNRSNHYHNQDQDDDDDDEELDVVNSEDVINDRLGHNLSANKQNASISQKDLNNNQSQLDEDFYIDSSVVRDFLEVGPPSSTSPTSSTSSVINNPIDHHQRYTTTTNPTTAKCQYPSNLSLSSNSSSTSNSVSPPVVPANAPSPLSNPAPATNPTVLVKFFLESSRSIVFIEVPIEHPFFVFHRGWSSWNPQRTYDKFGLKCRKLKIGDTCISLIRRQRSQSSQQESDQCNLLFSSIKINE